MCFAYERMRWKIDRVLGSIRCALHGVLFVPFLVALLLSVRLVRASKQYSVGDKGRTFLLELS
jgi:hypothetical protein